MAIEGLEQISNENIGNLQAKEIHDLWRRNHKFLFDYLQSENLPYFGLHGTSRQGLNGILRDRRCYLQLGTFYEKKER